MHGIYFTLGMVAFFCLLLPLVFRFERRQAWPYSALQPNPQHEDTGDYGARHVADAQRGGFKLLGFASDTKGKNYQTSYGMLVAPGRNTFAVIGWGKVAGMPVATTWLHTPTADGRSFYTTDRQVGVQLDRSHNWTNQLAMESDFPTLYGRHLKWIEAKQILPRGFTEGKEYEQFRQVRTEHFRQMEAAGLIRFADGSDNEFYFTWPGAFRTSLSGYFLGMLRSLTFGRFPRDL